MVSVVAMIDRVKKAVAKLEEEKAAQYVRPISILEAENRIACEIRYLRRPDVLRSAMEKAGISEVRIQQALSIMAYYEQQAMQNGGYVKPKRVEDSLQ